MKYWDRYQTTFHSIINFGFQMQHNFPNIRTNFPWEILSGPCLYLVHIENKNQEIYFDLFKEPIFFIITNHEEQLYFCHIVHKSTVSKWRWKFPEGSVLLFAYLRVNLFQVVIFITIVWFTTPNVVFPVMSVCKKVEFQNFFCSPPQCMFMHIATVVV